jgi:hypothetical protein
MRMSDTRLVDSMLDTVVVGGTTFPVKFLRKALPDVPTMLFFAKLYKATPQEVAQLVHQVMDSKITHALAAEAEAHSQDLQDFLADEYLDATGEWGVKTVVDGEVVDAAPPAHAEILPEIWKDLELEIADAISKVAETLRDTVARMPSRTGEMTFKTLAAVNAKRPVIGDYKAHIQHQHVKQVLVVLDVSGSMSEETIRTIVDDVVGLAYEANASLAIVSFTTTMWDPGQFNTQAVLDNAEFGGTHYETLAPVFNRDWDVVVTIADYDSSWSSKEYIRKNCSGKIGELLDISLVPRSTFLAECLGQLADEVRPLLISSTNLSY